MVSVFNRALAYTLEREGGYRYTETPDDAGKGTFAGLTAKTVASFYGRTLTASQMKAMTPTEVAAIYKTMYWDAIQGEKIPSPIIAMCLFDMAVLMGPVRAAMLAQSVVSQKTDGAIGPKTLAALTTVGTVAFVNAFSDLCDAFFAQIVANNPTQQKFLAGWQKRTSLMDHIAHV